MSRLDMTKGGGLAPAPQSTDAAPATGKKISRDGSQGTAFQAALNRAKGQEEEKKTAAAPSPAPSPNPSPTNSSQTSGGFGAPANNPLKPHMSVGPGAQKTDGRVEQELNNELAQSGLQSQTLKGEQASRREND